MARMTPQWLVTGEATHPDGYHDHLYYQGTSTWQALKSVIIGLRNGMRITIEKTR